MTDDLFAGPEEWDEFVQDVEAGLLPNMMQSGAAIAWVPSGPPDIRFTVQLGLMVLLDKPIVAVVEPGAKVPDKLRAVADAIVIGHPSQPDFQAKFTAAIHPLIRKHHP